MKKILAALAALLCLAIAPIASAEDVIYKPDPGWVKQMVRNLDDESMITTVRYREFVAIQLSAVHLDDNQYGDEAHFYFRENDEGKMELWWQMAIREPRQDGERGARITIWEFPSSDPGSALTWSLQTGVQAGDDRWMHEIYPGHPEWKRAMEMSRKAWDLLCKKFPCHTDS